MLKSMTGFGRCENVTNEYKISVEMKAVNHRYLDLSIKMPKKFNYFEASIRTLLKGYIQRGKVDLFINYEDYTEGNLCLKYNSVLAAEYMDYFQKMSRQFGIANDMTVSGLSRCPEVLTMERVPDDEEHLWEILSEALVEAAKQFVESRQIEGENLKRDLLGKLDYMDSLVDYIGERSPQILAEYRAKLTARMEEVLQSTTVDEQRILMEAAIYADKVAVDEETVRLRSHVAQLRTMLESDEPMGRKMDFLIQEVNRESNTIGSKCCDVAIAQVVVGLKAEVEKMREQVQNVE